MPKCKNDPKKTYKGTEPSPKGLGYCAHGEKLGKIRKGKDGNTWKVESTKSGILRWVKLKQNNKNIKKFNFNYNHEFKSYFEKTYKNNFEELMKYLKPLLRKLKLKNINNIEELGTNLEKKEIQNKIIQKIIKINKVPKNIINYYLKNSNNENITKETVIQYIEEYLVLKYNKLSILDFDIGYIFDTGKFNTLDEEGPREYICNKLNNHDKSIFKKIFKIL